MAHESARPCGCDPGCGWTCEDHRFINSVILETVNQLQENTPTGPDKSKWPYAPMPESFYQEAAEYMREPFERLVSAALETDRPTRDDALFGCSDVLKQMAGEMFITDIDLDLAKTLQHEYNALQSAVLDAPVYPPEMEPVICETCGQPNGEARRGSGFKLIKCARCILCAIPEFASTRPAEWLCQCLECGWKGLDTQLLAQACPVCDGRVADVEKVK